MDQEDKNMDGLIERNVKLSDNSGLGNVSDIIRNREAMSYEDTAKSNPMLLDLARESARRKLADDDQKLRDASADMLIMAQGPKAFTYVSPELTTALRTSNTIKTKDPMRITGVPTKKEISNAIEDSEAMDRLKWKLTGNGLKANAWIDSQNR